MFVFLALSKVSGTECALNQCWWEGLINEIQSKRGILYSSKTEGDNQVSSRKHIALSY